MRAMLRVTSVMNRVMDGNDETEQLLLSQPPIIDCLL